MDREVSRTVGFAGPIGTNGPRMLAQLFADRQHGAWREAEFVVSPELRLRVGDACPVATNERHDIVPLHAGIIAPTRSCRAALPAFMALAVMTMIPFQILPPRFVFVRDLFFPMQELPSPFERGGIFVRLYTLPDFFTVVIGTPLLFAIPAMLYFRWRDMSAICGSCGSSTKGGRIACSMFLTGAPRGGDADTELTTGRGPARPPRMPPASRAVRPSRRPSCGERAETGAEASTERPDARQDGECVVLPLPRYSRR
jgi:hypothetical protein